MIPSFVSRLLQFEPVWLGTDSGPDSIVFSSHIQLARNVQGFLFLRREKIDHRLTLRSLIETAIANSPGGDDFQTIDLASEDQMSRCILAERRLIQWRGCAGEPGSGLCLNSGKRQAVILNQYDHILLQAARAGLDFEHLWKDVTRLDDDLCQHLPIAFDPALGFLTAHPDNVGAGLKASVIVWLPGLVLNDHMREVIEAAKELQVNLQGLFGEGSHALGHLFELSIDSCLGDTEEDVLTRLDTLSRHLAESERAARVRFATDKRYQLTDLVGRAFGTLSQARLLSTQEAVGALFALRLGVLMNMFSRLNVTVINQLIMAVQRGHLAFDHPHADSAEARRTLRASLVRKVLEKAA